MSCKNFVGGELDDCCGGCCFYEPKSLTDSTHGGMCKKSAPKLYEVNEHSEPWTMYPRTSRKEWCGDFVSAEAYLSVKSTGQGTCMFCLWFSRKEIDGGICVLRGPDQFCWEGKITTHWPIVHEGCRCGEFEFVFNPVSVEKTDDNKTIENIG